MTPFILAFFWACQPAPDVETDSGSPDIVDPGTDIADTDVDGDGIPDADDPDLTDGPLADPDDDGWTNEVEAANGTNPNLADTDSDGIIDSEDICPLDADPGQTDSNSDGIGDACTGACSEDDSAACDGVCEPGEESSPDCDELCMLGEAGSADCDGVCDIGDTESSPDCDAVCDRDDEALSADCDDLCDEGDSPESADCDDGCDPLEDGPDCDGGCNEDDAEDSVDCDGVCTESDALGSPDCDGVCDTSDTPPGPDCDGSCGTGDTGIDCNGRCDADDSLDGSDCDGACDASDNASSPDCDDVCSVSDSASGPDCDDICGPGDAEDGPDCDGVCDEDEPVNSPDCGGGCAVGSSPTAANCDGVCHPGDERNSPDCDGVCGAGDAGVDCDGVCGNGDVADGTDCDGVCGAGDGQGSLDCDNRCDLTDLAGSHDCDGVCETGDAVGSADCDGVCQVGEGLNQPDCDAVCDPGDEANSRDCDAVCDPNETLDSVDCDGSCSVSDHFASVDCTGGCTAEDDPESTACDGSCGSDEVEGSWDCDGVCDEQDHFRGIDCDGICDLDETLDSADCDDRCDAGELAGSAGCDGVCGDFDTAGSGDCDGVCRGDDDRWGADCDGVCDGDEAGSIDCDGNCGPADSEVDCDGICSSGDLMGSSDCDGSCDVVDAADSRDCDGVCDDTDDPESQDCYADGVCGPAHGGSTLGSPDEGHCASGRYVPSETYPPYTWTCEGTGGGASVACTSNLSCSGNGQSWTVDGSECSAVFESRPHGGTLTVTDRQQPTLGSETFTCDQGTWVASGEGTCRTEIDAVCGSAHDSNVSTAPTSGLCAAGTPSSVQDTGTGVFGWTCSGSGGGHDLECYANRNCDSVELDWRLGDAECSGSLSTAISGEVQTVTDTSRPTLGEQRFSCSQGTWSPAGDATCVTVIDGACGPADGASYLDFPPMDDLCSSGFNDGGVSGTGPYTWECAGRHGGTTAQCSSNRDCRPQTLFWNGDGASCSQRVDLTEHGGRATALDQDQPHVGSRDYDCVQGAWEPVGAGVCEVREDGVCGSADGSTSSAPPTSLVARCSAGTSSPVSGTGPYTWTCYGEGLGEDVQCSQNRSCLAADISWGEGCGARQESLGERYSYRGYLENTNAGYQGDTEVFCSQGVWSTGQSYCSPAP